MTKPELIEILINEYGYEKEDIKLLTNAKLKKLIKDEEADAKQLELEDSMPVAPKQKMKDDDVVLVMNGQSGSITHHSFINNRTWKYTEFGQIQKMTYEEIQAINFTKPSVFRNGYLVIMNPVIQEELGLTEIYKNILTPDNAEKIFQKEVDEIELFIDNLPSGMKITFLGKARELIERDELTDTRIIRFIEKKFGISLNDNAPLSDVVVSSKNRK